METVCSVESASVRYGQSDALKAVNLELRSGEILGLIGPNGAGKTTLLNILVGLLPVREGCVSIEGVELSSLAPSERAKKVSLLEAHPYSSFPMTVRELIELSQNAMGTNGDLITEAINLTGAQSLLDRNILELSSGELKRAFIAHLLVQNSRIILADEIFSNLDWSFKLSLVRALKSWRDKFGTSFVLAIHDLEILTRFVDRLVLLHNGEVVNVGAPQEVLKSETFVKAFGVSIDDILQM